MAAVPANSSQDNLRQRTRKDGTPGLWELRVRRDGHRFSFYGRTKAEAYRKSEKQVQRVLQTARVRETVGGWLNLWIADLKGTVKPSTWKRYESLVRVHIVPALGDVRLDMLTTARLDSLYKSLRTGGLGAQSVIHVHRTLHTALESAVAAGLLRDNPARSRVLRQKAPEKQWTILSRTEATRLLDAARGDRLEALYVLALTLGMRQGELLALRWRDLDLDGGTLTVSGTAGFDDDGKQARGSPKTTHARRTLLLPERAVDALRRTSELDPVYVFPATRGGLMRGTVLMHTYFDPLLTCAGLPHMRFHDLRHTAATHLLEDGNQPHVVSRILGHASVGITLGLYAHVTRGMSDQAVTTMNARYT